MVMREGTEAELFHDWHQILRDIGRTLRNDYILLSLYSGDNTLSLQLAVAYECVSLSSSLPESPQKLKELY